MDIAVIGSGITGLSAAYCLGKHHQVTVFEAERRFGGHSNTVMVDTAVGEQAIDTGFIVCNPVNYPNFYNLMGELRVPLQNSDMSLGVSVEQGRIEWAGSDSLLSVFAQPGLAVSPTHLGMLLSVIRFNRHVKRLLAEDALPDITLGEFLEQHRYPMALRLRYVAAMAGPIWSMSTEGVMDFPFPTFARFFQSHGLLNVVDRPQWMTVVGGSQRYVERLCQRTTARFHADTPVQHLRRADNGVHVHTADGEARFDAVVCATHSDQALALLDQPTEEETQILGAVPFARNRAVLHTDTSLMPRRRRAWSSWNALLDADALNDQPIAVSYWMNRLQNLRGDQSYIMTLNPPREPDPATVVYETEYTHPQYRPETVAAQQRLPSVQGRGGIWWAGAWTGYGFHEDGLKAGLRAAAGIDPQCAPHWAEGL
ncbi:MAG: NAD(P)/FAD-dependent oxidoreductase [Algiphilus sp.]